MRLASRGSRGRGMPALTPYSNHFCIGSSGYRGSSGGGGPSAPRSGCAPASDCIETEMTRRAPSGQKRVDPAAEFEINGSSRVSALRLAPAGRGRRRLWPRTARRAGRWLGVQDPSAVRSRASHTQSLPACSALVRCQAASDTSSSIMPIAISGTSRTSYLLEHPTILTVPPRAADSVSTRRWSGYPAKRQSVGTLRVEQRHRVIRAPGRAPSPLAPPLRQRRATARS